MLIIYLKQGNIAINDRCLSTKCYLCESNNFMN